jgi:NTE family protein
MKTGLALSGGALRGIFHLGVLQALDELDVKIDILSGTSVGAIVATLYSSGHSPKAILEIATSSSLYKMLRLKPWAGGLLSPSYLKSLLEEHLLVENFEDLDRPVYVTASNLRTGQVEVFSQGKIVPVVLASSAIPLMFNPVKLGAEYYLDGGLIMNLPVSPIRDLCSKVIAVNLVPEVELPLDDSTNFIKVAERTFDIALMNNVKPELELADHVITLDGLKDVKRLSFDGMSKVFDMGYEATLGQKAQLYSLLQTHVG